ncbi:sel1 repeat family protein [Achromobacter sp. SD115]|uniref:tetratricopeptide repeat protein n=1 Tax=Achromobacter sp. SD115 TaxID=2782011 RepID=UPI001A957EB9|nr:tetratricopeptide repeat protein [Achromobacter sp. SD115]MBO1017712.1 sel1 repeat family protein [Achromobacter sp. SD115]
MKSYTAADVAATTPEELARLREQGPAEDYAAWIRAAAELGLIEAQTIYGQMLLDGAGVERDQEQGLAWFKRAAHADHPMAINMVGRCYENGWGVPRDDTVAAYWFRLAADNGLDWGMYNYAHMLRSGRGGVAQNSAAALALYQKAAQAGHVKSIGVVGRYYEAGDVVEQDLDRAFDCYQRCAEGGDFRGMFHLGRLLLLRGRKEDAVQWLIQVPETATPAFLREANDMLQASGFPPLYEGIS